MANEPSKATNVTNSQPESEKGAEAKAKPPTLGELIEATAAQADKNAKARAKQAEAAAEETAAWDAVHDQLAAFKGQFEHDEGAPIRQSKLWGVLAAVQPPQG